MSPAERNLRTLAAAAGYRSLYHLARFAHVDRLTIRLALRGETTPQRSTLERLASTLHVEPEIVERVFEGARG